MAIVKISLFVFIFLVQTLLFQYSFADTMVSLRRPTVVIGFQSRLADDPTAGNWFTRVTIREMQKIPVVRTPPADNVNALIKKMGFSIEQAFNPTNAAAVAKKMECSQFIFGFLEPADKNGKIKVRFLLYDAVDLEILVDDTVVVNGGAGLYDALDKFQKEIVGALFDESTLPAKLGLSITTGKALVSVNDGEIKEVEKNRYVWLRLRPKAKVGIKYYDYYTRMLLFSTNVVLLPDSEQSLEYKPLSRLEIDGLPGAKVIKSDGTELNIPTNGNLKTQISALINEPLTIETREKRFRLELESKVNSDVRITSIKTPDPRGIDYSSSWPFMNVLIPGFAQYQANDILLGSFFTALAAGGAGLVFFGFYADAQMQVKATETTFPEDIRKFQTYGELYRTMGYIGAGLWVLSAIVSGTYGYLHPTRFIDPALPDRPLSLYIAPDGIGLNFRWVLS